MSEPKDPEKLLADALRAQAVFAPSAERAAEATTDKPAETDTESNLGAPGAHELPLQYGLLSGAGAGSLERERVALEDAETARLAERPTPPPAPSPSSPPLPAYWVLLLAVLLGLAAGSVIGLLTLI